MGWYCRNVDHARQGPLRSLEQPQVRSVGILAIVKRQFPTEGLRVLDHAGKLLLTVVGLAGFLLALSLVGRVHKLFSDTRNGPANLPPVVAAHPAPPSNNHSSDRPFWPEF